MTRMHALAAVLGLIFAAQAANAQCGDIADAPDEAFALFSDRLEPFAPVADEAVCTKMAKAVGAACHAAVSDVASCYEGLAGSSYKVTKAACATTQDPKACTADAKAQLELDKQGIAEDAAGADPECDADAEAFFFVCMEGFPA